MTAFQKNITQPLKTLQLFVLLSTLFLSCRNYSWKLDSTFKGFIYKKENVEYILKDEEASFAFTSDYQRLIICKNHNIIFDTILDVNSSWRFDSISNVSNDDVTLIQTEYDRNPNPHKRLIVTSNHMFKIGIITKNFTQSLYPISDSCTQINFVKNKITFTLHSSSKQISVSPWEVRFKGYNGTSNEIDVYYNDSTYPNVFILKNSSDAYLRLVNFYNR